MICKKLYFHFANILRGVLQLQVQCRDRCYFAALPPKLRIDFLRANALDYYRAVGAGGAGGPWPPDFGRPVNPISTRGQIMPT